MSPLYAELVDRKWLLAGAIAAILAIVGGAYFARTLLSDDSDSAAPARPHSPFVVFHETASDVTLHYPSSWKRLPTSAGDAALVVASPDKTRSLLMRISVTGLQDITARTLSIARRYTDPLVSADKTVKLLGPPEAVSVGGLLGYRYRYTYHGAKGAHDHYFLFKRGRMIALVFQATPASRLAAAEAQFQRIAVTFDGSGTR